MYCESLFFVIEKFSSLRLLIDENFFTSENFSHLKFFFTEEFQNPILTKMFHKKILKAKFKQTKISELRFILYILYIIIDN